VSGLLMALSYFISKSLIIFRIRLSNLSLGTLFTSIFSQPCNLFVKKMITAEIITVSYFWGGSIGLCRISFSSLSIN
jgi:hypothetical protein